MKSIWTINIAGRLPMLRVRQFLSNPAYIWYYLKRFFWFKYISHRYIKLYSDFKFLSGPETVEKLLRSRMSLARFSDGEIDMLTGMGVFDPKMEWSQPYSPSLKKALLRSLKTKHKDLLIAHTSPYKFLASKEEAIARGISYTMWTDSRLHLYKFLASDSVYGDAHCFIGRDNPHIDWSGIKHFLKQHDVVVVTGGVDNLKQLSLGQRTFFIEAGRHDAWSRYEQIKQDIESLFLKEGLNKEKTLIMASLGPTASVLATELAIDNYLIWDSGHIFKYATTNLR